MAPTSTIRETPDQIIVRCAAPTGGVTTRQDLLDAGVSGTAIQRRLASGFLRKPCRGVYLCTDLEQTLTRYWIPLLAIPTSVLSRQTASELHDLRLPRSSMVHVTAGKGTGWTLPHTMVHETRLPVAEDVVRLGEMRVTSKARTLFDSASYTRRSQFRHGLQSAVAAEPALAVDFMACFRALARSGVAGVRMMRMILMEDFDDEPVAESELERLVWLGLFNNGLIGLHRQYRPPWFDGIRGIVDFACPVSRVIIEADGRRWHSSQQAMANDRRRDRQASIEGWVVLRVSWNEVVHRPAATFGEIRRVVDARKPLRAA